MWLLLLWAAFLFGGFILGPTRNNRRIPRWARLASSLILVIAAWGWQSLATPTLYRTYTTLIALGMTSGFIGDLFLANIFTSKRSKAVLGGMGGFAIGHLFYIAGMLMAASTLQLTNIYIFGATLILFWLFAFWSWRKIVIRNVARDSQRPSTLQRAALPYALLLATTAALALAAALQHPPFWPLALGTILFLLSDLLLAEALFNDSTIPLHHDLVWLLYGPGQMFIVYSTMMLLK